MDYDVFDRVEGIFAAVVLVDIAEVYDCFRVVLVSHVQFGKSRLQKV